MLYPIDTTVFLPASHIITNIEWVKLEIDHITTIIKRKKKLVKVTLMGESVKIQAQNKDITALRKFQ